MYIYRLSVYLVINSHPLTCAGCTNGTNQTMTESDVEGLNSLTVDRTCKPLYLKNNDLRSIGGKPFTDYDLIEPVKQVIGDDLLCVQLDRNLWRVYLKNTENRNKLPVQGIEISNISYQFYDTNPYTSGAKTTDQKTLKIRVCGLPLSVADTAVLEMLEKQGVKLVSKILYEKIRYPEIGRMTSILNGTRFMFVEPSTDGKYLPIVQVFNAKFFIMVNLKKQKT